ncbi:MAG TPA: hypothetical protein VFJ58_23040 [Armatimonadota bacterium]|nr:hypothetical protein [Armatimonadota bacterium]
MRLFPAALGLIAVATAASAAGPVIAANKPRKNQPDPATATPRHTLPFGQRPAPRHQPGVFLIPTQFPGFSVYLIPTQWKSELLLVPASNRSPRPAASHAKPEPPNSAAHPLIIGKAQDRHTVTVRKGEYIELRLQPDLTWKFEPIDKKILKAIKPTVGQEEFEAVAPGTTTIKGYGRMKPKPGQMTAMFVILYQVTIQVRN